MHEERQDRGKLEEIRMTDKSPINGNYLNKTREKPYVHV